MKYIPLVLIVLFSISCNKENKRSNKLMPFMNMNGKEYSGVWHAKDLSVEGEPNLLLPTLVIDECDIFNDTCYGVWRSGGGDASFSWQFQDKGKSFLISRIEHQEFNSSLVNVADLQCYRLSGVYKVKKASRKKMIFECSSTIGYPESLVKLTLERGE